MNRPGRPARTVTLALTLTLTLAVASITTACRSSHPADAHPAAAASGSQPAAPAATAAALTALAGKDLQLRRLVVDGTVIPLPVAPTSTPTPTLRFGESGRISGRSAVNRYGGSFSLGPDGALTWPGPGLAMTRMAGPEPAMKLEQQFTQALTATTRLFLPPDGALFRDTDGRNLVEFGPATPVAERR